MNVTIHYTIEEIKKITKGNWFNKNEKNRQPAYLSLDSRKIMFPELTIFFAIKTSHRNANLFIESLYKNGVRNFVTDDKSIDPTTIPLANIILVSDTIEALQKLAIHYRNQFKKRKHRFLVIGITGSNGKTIVKEWLNQLLEKEYSIVRSPKSFNSQIGVPISILNINNTNELAIFEAGISIPGEMAKLEKIIKPDIGILTNIGNAHDEGFATRQQKIREKLMLFRNAHHLVFCADNKEVYEEIKNFKKKNSTLQLFSWGKNNRSVLQVKSIKKNNSFTIIEGIYKRKKVSITIPFTDDASIENAVNCWCVLFILNKTGKETIQRFNTLYPIEMRLELKQGINHCTIINDSYSNDLNSLHIALDFLNQQKQHPVRTIILSDILQSGRKPKELYEEVAALIQQNKIDRFFGIGPDLFSQQKEFSFLETKLFFKTTDHFLKSISQQNFKDETILIKGARQFEFEKISHALEQKVHQTVLSINLSALVYNLKKYKEKVLPATKIMAMVKAFSYGSGSYEIASMLEYNKVDYLAVAYADEGVELRKAGISLPIMVMNIDNSSFDSIVNYHLEPEIFSFALLNDFIQYLNTSEIIDYPIHLKIDTGMHRLGFMEKEINRLCQLISGNNSIKIKSVFSHLAASDEEKEDDFTLKQFILFKSCCRKIKKALSYHFDTHIANTSAISRLPQLQMDMVRLGIGLYGIDSNKKMQKHLRNVSSLTTTISQIKKLKAGESVGYGRNTVLQKESIIAVVRIGYADGYSRQLSNGKGKMLVKNKWAPVIGNICMDMTMLDISDIKDVKEGDEVIVFGESVPIQKLAEWSHTIPYEIMTGISQRVKRIYFEE
ncbi:MAG: bifunctional UDP-N-acetylmuramoyl-tripeptide:D-alanyl-D-alanine ligase/alanine racemase [Bacteroidota bacterium]|nr:bifunctional UDP-N-acetylmuramoyl-tripeptide:D-alanyl-D-alanine ligase/alanine racemase [Bacteroidota bacterium]